MNIFMYFLNPIMFEFVAGISNQNDQSLYISSLMEFNKYIFWFRVFW